MSYMKSGFELGLRYDPDHKVRRWDWVVYGGNLCLVVGVRLFFRFLFLGLV